MCCNVSTVKWKLDLRLCGCSFQSTDTSSTTDMKCEIRSSCFLPGCLHTDLTVDPYSSITQNCSISSGKHALGMTWKQARQEVQNSTGLSDLVLLKSNSTKDSGNTTCYCTNINFIRRCFFSCSVGNGREWLWSLTNFQMIKFRFLFRPWSSQKNTTDVYFCLSSWPIEIFQLHNYLASCVRAKQMIVRGWRPFNIKIASLFIW